MVAVSDRALGDYSLRSKPAVTGNFRALLEPLVGQ
jgi:hypothetical protein